MAWTRLSLKRGLRLIRDSSARMSSYCLSRYPTISEKLSKHSQRADQWDDSSGGMVAPGLIVDLVTETRGINDGEGDASSFLIKLEFCIAGQTSFVCFVQGGSQLVPTVMGLILTPSSTWAELASSDSLWLMTGFPQRVLTKVVLPVETQEKSVSKWMVPINGSWMQRS